MERRALIALALSFVVFMVFIYFGDKMKPPVAPAPATQTTATQPQAPAPAPPPAAVRPTSPAPSPVKAPAGLWSWALPAATSKCE